MRFKGNDCNYNDHLTWAFYEELARTKNGFISGSDYYNSLFSLNRASINRVAHKKCDFKIAQWAFFEITLGAYIDWGYWGKSYIFSKDLKFIAK